MRIVILGCGRLGSRAAASFVKRGDRVTIVDAEDEKLRLAPQESRRILGDVVDDHALEKAFAEGADLCLVATGKDPLNILLAQKVRVRFGVGRVLLRIFDPELSAVYRTLGLEVICPTLQALSEIERLTAGPGAAPRAGAAGKA
jgi:trk system potassium uptake protein TrkA